MIPCHLSWKERDSQHLLSYFPRFDVLLPLSITSVDDNRPRASLAQPYGTYHQLTAPPIKTSEKEFQRLAAVWALSFA